MLRSAYVKDLPSTVLYQEGGDETPRGGAGCAGRPGRVARLRPEEFFLDRMALNLNRTEIRGVDSGAEKNLGHPEGRVNLRQGDSGWRRGAQAYRGEVREIRVGLARGREAGRPLGSPMNRDPELHGPGQKDGGVASAPSTEKPPKGGPSITGLLHRCQLQPGPRDSYQVKRCPQPFHR